LRSTVTFYYLRFTRLPRCRFDYLRLRLRLRCLDTLRLRLLPPPPFATFCRLPLDVTTLLRHRSLRALVPDVAFTVFTFDYRPRCVTPFALRYVTTVTTPRCWLRLRLYILLLPRLRYRSLICCATLLYYNRGYRLFVPLRYRCLPRSLPAGYCVADCAVDSGCYVCRFVTLHVWLPLLPVLLPVFHRFYLHYRRSFYVVRVYVPGLRITFALLLRLLPFTLLRVPTFTVLRFCAALPFAPCVYVRTLPRLDFIRLRRYATVTYHVLLTLDYAPFLPFVVVTRRVIWLRFTTRWLRVAVALLPFTTRC